MKETLWMVALVLSTIRTEAGVASTTRDSFGVFMEGINPYVEVMQGSDGSFYGSTCCGGTNGYFYQGVFLASSHTVLESSTKPMLQVVALSAGTLCLTWSAEAGGRYQLQWNSDPSSNNWTNLGCAVTATGVALSASDSVTNSPRRFYRIVLLP